MNTFLILLGIILLAYIFLKNSPTQELSVDEIVKSRIEQAKEIKLSADVWFLIEHFVRKEDSELHLSDESSAKESGLIFRGRRSDSESYSVDATMLNSDITIKVGNTKIHYLPDDSYEDKTIEIYKGNECVLSFRVNRYTSPYYGMNDWVPRDTVDGFIPGEWIHDIKKCADKARHVYGRLQKELESKRAKEDQDGKRKRFGI